MSNSEWRKIKDIFYKTLDLPEAERGGFLAEQDDFVRSEVLDLIASHEKSKNFIEEPAIIEFGLNTESLVGKKIGAYKLLEPIGAGGMGTVFLAEKEGLNKKFALKLIKRGMDTDEVLRRFKIEQQILGRLEHPNIASLLDGGMTDDGLPYLVMDFVDGVSITKYCDNNRLDTKDRLNLFRTVCSAVSYAHQNLIIHRDLKPSNILVTREGLPKLLDFGIAKLLDPESLEGTATSRQARMFTPEYASPEQINGLRVTTASDVYALGVVLYELLSGQRPFQTKSRSYHEIVSQILTNEPLKPSAISGLAVHSSTRATENNKDHATSVAKQISKPLFRDLRSLRGDIDNIILKSLRKEPERRYQSVQEFAEDIRRHLTGLPVTATADSGLYRFSKFVTRHRRAVLLSTFIALVFVSLSGLVFQQYLEAKTQRDKANVRLTKLRETAKLFMTDTRDSLAKIPGTVLVRKQLAEKSVNLLDAIYDETTTDVAFLSELAEAYEQLGRLQNWQFRDFEKAVSANMKAVTIRRRIVELDSESTGAKTDLAKSLALLAEAQNSQPDKNRTLRFLAEYESIVRDVAATDPTIEYKKNLAAHLIGSAEWFKSWDMDGEHKKKLDEGLLIIQSVNSFYQSRALTAQEKTDYASNLMFQAAVFESLNDEERAIQNYLTAAKLSESAFKEDKTIEFAFNHTSRSHRHLGLIYEKQGKYQKALDMYRFSFEWLESRKNDPARIRIGTIYGLLYYSSRCALMLEKLGKRKEAETLIEQPLRDFSELVNLEEDAENVINAPENFSDLAKYFAQTNRLEKGVELWTQHSNRIQKFLDKNPNDINFINFQLTAQQEIAQLYSDYDEKSGSFRTTDKTRLSKAKSHYEIAAKLYQKSQSMYRPTQSEQESLRKLRDKISKIRV